MLSFIHGTFRAGSGVVASVVHSLLLELDVCSGATVVVNIRAAERAEWASGFNLNSSLENITYVITTRRYIRET